jgi:chromosome segregation ATPase
MPDTIISLKKQNDALKAEIDSLQRNFNKLQDMFESYKEPVKRNHEDTSSKAQYESFETSLQFLSDKYDSLSNFEAKMTSEMNRLSARIAEISSKVDNVGDALDQAQEYSYQYNIKIVGLPEQNDKELATETSTICVNLFKSIGADVNMEDIDIAHRVPSRNQDNRPRPIICKFVRRIVKDDVMKRQREIPKVNSTARIFDHLTPKQQNILYESKKFKEQNSYQYCWTKT